jgi:hypothetical protein
VDALPAVELAWSQSPGGDRCLDRGSLVAKVEETVGHRVFVSGGPADTVIDGSIGPAPRGWGWVAVVEARRAGTTAFRRELALDGPDCHRLDEAIVLVVALMVDSAKHAAPLAIPAAPESQAASIGADVAIALGMLPGAAAGFGLATDLKIPPLWPIALRTHAWPVSQAIEGGSGGRLGAWTFGAGLCPLTLTARSGKGDWGLYACVGATGGAIYSNGVGLDVTRDNTRPYLQVEVWTGLRLRIAGPLFAVVELEGAVPFAHDSYSYTQADGTVRDVFKTSPFIPLGHARVEVRVP